MRDRNPSHKDGRILPTHILWKAATGSCDNLWNDLPQKYYLNVNELHLQVLQSTDGLFVIQLQYYYSHY